MKSRRNHPRVVAQRLGLGNGGEPIIRPAKPSRITRQGKPKWSIIARARKGGLGRG